MLVLTHASASLVPLAFSLKSYLILPEVIMEKKRILFSVFFYGLKDQIYVLLGRKGGGPVCVTS
jgi:hypothetical protein